MTLYLDIETVPREDAKDKLIAGVKPPATITKEETLAKWDAESRPAAEDEAFRGGGLNALYGQVVCIGYAFDDSEAMTLSSKNEPELLRNFFHVVDLTGGPSCVVGHAVSTFDLPFLWQRCRLLGVKVSSWMPAPGVQPWKTPIPVYDTKTEWSGSRGKPARLSEICWAMGIPCKTGMDGAQVYDAWVEGRHDEIAAYCREDVEAVRAVYRRMVGA